MKVKIKVNQKMASLNFRCIIISLIMAANVATTTFAEQSWLANRMGSVTTNNEDSHTVTPTIIRTSTLTHLPQKTDYQSTQQQTIDISTEQLPFWAQKNVLSSKDASIEPKFSKSFVGNEKIGSTITAALPKSQRDSSPEKHWSALENYYQRLKPSLYRTNPPNNDEIQKMYKFLQTEINDRDPSPFYYTNFRQPLGKESPFFYDSQFQNFHTKPINKQYEVQVPIFVEADRRRVGGEKSVHYESAPGVSRVDDSINPKIFIGSGNQKIWQIQRPDVSSTAPGNTRIEYIDLQKLPELLFIQQQQQRAKYQQETQGSWYDHRRVKELLQEEAYCGPRNYVKLKALSSKQPTIISTSLNSREIILEKLLQEPSVLGIALGSNEYPSHIGIYNGSAQKEENFLCGASWTNDRFATTLASCVLNVDANKLEARIGEWNIDKETNNDRTIVTIQIKKVHVFPKYLNTSSEHNIALLEFARPLEYLQMPYVTPACQLKARSQTSSLPMCWTPVRNKTISEYFDANEGATLEKKTISMLEKPVRLILYDDIQCQQATRAESFYLRHPNYLCSDDYKVSSWRSELNQTSYFGSGIYCYDNGNLNLVSMIHPIYDNDPSSIGYIDLKFYEPWMKSIIREPVP